MYVEKVYRREHVSPAARSKLATMQRCAFTPDAGRNMRRLARSEARARVARKRADRNTPYGRWAIPFYVVLCESRGRNLPPNSAGASGYYQMLVGTFRSMGGRTTHAYQSPKAEQDRAAHRLWTTVGPSQWVCA